MKRLTIRSGIIDVLIVFLIGGVNFCLTFYSFLHFYGFMPGGEKTYYHWEINVNAFIISLLLWLVEFLIVRKFIKRRTKVVFYGVYLVLVMSLTPVFAYGASAFNYEHFFQKFDAIVWFEDDCKPLNMVCRLKKEREFLRLSRAEVIHQLGEGNYLSDSTSIHYYTDDKNTCVELLFKNDELYFYRLYWCGKGGSPCMSKQYE